MTLSRQPFGGTLVAALLLLCSGLPSYGQAVAIPRTTGPVAVTPTSKPFLASEKNLVPLNLATVGYVEEEFIISGNANVYNWQPDGSISIRVPNAPYATRILVRRPAAANRFSGNVIVEMLHSARRFDWPMIWGYSRDFLIENGDAWVGITMPNAVAGLRTFNPERYSAVSFANPSPTPCTPGSPRSEIEDGLRWDAISQIAALLKSTVPQQPLASMNVQAVFLTMQGGELQTYINAIHPHASLSSGKAPYDGFLVKSPAAPVRLNQCDTAPPANDSRRAIRKTNVPVITVVAQGEVVDAAPYLRADSDAADDKFRVYEIAGAGHIDKTAYAGFPDFPDQVAAVGSAQGTPDWPFNMPCTPPIPMMSVPIMAHALDAAFLTLEEWVRKGKPAPRAPRIQIRGAGTPEAAVITDANGIGTGGVRNPYIEAPASVFATNSPGPGVCREMGREELFDRARFQSAYPTPKAYIDRVGQVAEELVKERWLTESDARRIKMEAQSRPSK
jgi:hypothetical protein